MLRTTRFLILVIIWIALNLCNQVNADISIIDGPPTPHHHEQSNIIDRAMAGFSSAIDAGLSYIEELLFTNESSIIGKESDDHTIKEEGQQNETGQKPDNQEAALTSTSP